MRLPLAPVGDERDDGAPTLQAYERDRREPSDIDEAADDGRREIRVRSRLEHVELHRKRPAKQVRKVRKALPGSVRRAATDVPEDRKVHEAIV